jgi:hypothetical protein
MSITHTTAINKVSNVVRSIGSDLSESMVKTILSGVQGIPGQEQYSGVLLNDGVTIVGDEASVVATWEEFLGLDILVATVKG